MKIFTEQENRFNKIYTSFLDGREEEAGILIGELRVNELDNFRAFLADDSGASVMVTLSEGLKLSAIWM